MYFVDHLERFTYHYIYILYYLASMLSIFWNTYQLLCAPTTVVIMVFTISLQITVRTFLNSPKCIFVNFLKINKKVCVVYHSF